MNESDSKKSSRRPALPASRTRRVRRRGRGRGGESEFAERLVQLLIAGCWALLLLAASLCVASYIFSQQLTYDHSIERMFVRDDPVLGPYSTLQRYLGGNEIVLAVYEDESLLAPDGSGLQRLRDVAAALRESDGVEAVVSLEDLNRAMVNLYSLGGAVPTDAHPLVDPDNALAQEFLQIFSGYTHSADGRYASLACLLAPVKTTEIPRHKTIAELRNIIRAKEGGKITGEPVMVVDGFRFLQNDGKRLTNRALVLVGLVIVVCFRSVRWVVIPLAVVFFTLWVTRGVVGAMGLKLTMVSSMFTSVVVVIAIATTVHVIVRFRELRLDQQSVSLALQGTLAGLLGPILWSCWTDAAGFGALMVSQVAPVRDFGLMMAIAALVVPLGVYSIVPGLALLGEFDTDPNRTWGEQTLKTALNQPTVWAERRPRLWMGCLCGVVLVALLGMLQLRVETDFTKNFRADSQIVQDVEFVEERFSGAGIMDLLVPVQGKLTPEFLEKVDALQQELQQLTIQAGKRRGEPALTKVISLADADRAARHTGVLALIPFPLRFETMHLVMPKFVAAMYSEESDRAGQGWFRIMLRTTQRQTSDEKDWLMQQITSIAQRHFPEKPGEATVQTTGFFVLLSRLVSSVLRDQNVAILVATIAIFGMMWIALRSLRIAAIALVPNLLPVMVVMGTLGWLRIPINMGAAMISAVSIGLSVDSSIHYLWMFRKARLNGHSLASSIQAAQQRAGRAMFYSTVALVIGFSSLCISEFIPTVYFGLLTGLTMIGGLLGNLFLLPLLLTQFGGGVYRP